MQLFSQPAEDLANRLTATSNGAFEMCAFLSGGRLFGFCISGLFDLAHSPGTEAMESAMKLAIQVLTFILHAVPRDLTILSSIFVKSTNHGAKTSSGVICLTTGSASQPCHSHITQISAPLTRII